MVGAPGRCGERVSKKGQLDGSGGKMSPVHQSENSFEERIKQGKSDEMYPYAGRR